MEETIPIPVTTTRRIFTSSIRRFIQEAAAT
jgi:hypothetical protein